ncbi:MAG: DUF1802 family protein [Chthoniobacterales bacterium]
MQIGFKEWALVCEALGTGQQSLILRKGGIAEGRDGFRFKHEEFCLFPTWFHEQLSKTTLSRDITLPEQSEDEIEIRYSVVVEWTKLVTDLEKLKSLHTLHILHESVLDERFHYDDEKGVHVAFVRVFRLDPPARLKMEKRYGGCRSWVDLTEDMDAAMVSVISDEEHSRRRQLLEKLLS